MKVLFLKDYGGIYEVGDAIELPEEQTKALIGAGYCKADPAKSKPKAKAKKKK